MASGAILSSEHESPRKRLATFVRFDVPLLRATEYRGREVDLLLLAWSLLLYRYSNGSHIQFTWGQNGTAADFTFDFNSVNIYWDVSDPVSKALKDVQKYREQVRAENLVVIDNAIVFFNDECAPSDLPSAQVSDSDALGGGMVWVRAAQSNTEEGRLLMQLV